MYLIQILANEINNLNNAICSNLKNDLVNNFNYYFHSLSDYHHINKIRYFHL